MYLSSRNSALGKQPCFNLEEALIKLAKISVGGYFFLGPICNFFEFKNTVLAFDFSWVIFDNFGLNLSLIVRFL